MLEEAGYFIGYTGKGWFPGLNEPGGRKRNPAGPEFNELKCEAPVGIKKFDYASNFERFYKSKPKDKPFCFWFGCHEPHRKYMKGCGLKSGKKVEDVIVPSFLPDTLEVRSDILDYYVEIEWFDKHLSRMIQIIEKAGELENTVIVVTSDNGMPFPRAKATLYDHGIRIPLAVRWPERMNGGRIIDDFISFVDFAPTFIEAAGLKACSEMRGVSFLNLLTSKRDGRIDINRNRIFSGMERHAMCRLNNTGYPMRAIRNYEYLYIHNYKPERWPAGDPVRWWRHEIYGEIDPSPTKKYMMNNRHLEGVQHLFRLAFEKRAEEELYDLRKDPFQVKNVASLPQYVGVRKKLREDLDRRLIETEDPRSTDQKVLFDCYQVYMYRIIERTDDGLDWKR
jgi:N-sulfoglucosamine sulfohydrolase